MENSEIAGFTDQSERNKAWVNANKVAEENILRMLDILKDTPDLDQRCVAEARTCIQTGFMWMNRAIFQPTRIALPSDAPVNPPHNIPPPSPYVGAVYQPDSKNTSSLRTDSKGNALVAIGPHWYLQSDVDDYNAKVAAADAAQQQQGELALKPDDIPSTEASD